MTDLTYEYVSACLAYNAETGELRWKVRPREHFKHLAGFVRFDRHLAGKRAGVLDTAKNYRRVKLAKRLLQEHRVTWLLHYGEWPNLDIDHINRDRSDNRICNLRLATSSQNAHNTVLSSSNTSGYKGVSWESQTKKWRACLWFENTLMRLGRFSTPEEAYAVVSQKRNELLGEFSTN
jgi:hypothetical protein